MINTNWTQHFRMQMMQQLASRLKELHGMGYVHRDLKPGNVMWLPRENRWTVIDFGCVGKVGEVSRLAFSMGYAAPEVIAAFRRGDRTIVVQVHFLFRYFVTVCLYHSPICAGDKVCDHTY